VTEMIRTAAQITVTVRRNFLGSVGTMFISR
jgi:hypothetical protein